MAETTKIQNNESIDQKKKTRITSSRLWFAIIMALVFIQLAYAVIKITSQVGLQVTAMCPEEVNSLLLWKIWFHYLMAGVMYIGGLIPSVLVLLNRRWWWVFLFILADLFAAAILFWLWVPVLLVFGC